MRHFALACCICALAGCNEGSSPGPADTTTDSVADASDGSGDMTGDTPDTGSDAAPDATPAGAPPTDPNELRTWLETDGYVNWAAEDAVHASAGPHFGDVRVFANAKLAASLAAGNAAHPVGSAAVKELYASSTEVQGWSVIVKTQESGGGDAWYWYELYQGSVLAQGQGSGSCTGCHSAGADYVLSTFP